VPSASNGTIGSAFASRYERQMAPPSRIPIGTRLKRLRKKPA
jgi:hypothetical protein